MFIKRKRKINKFLLIFTALIVLCALFVNRVRIFNIYYEFRKLNLPEAREFEILRDNSQQELENELNRLQEEDLGTEVNSLSDDQNKDEDSEFIEQPSSLTQDTIQAFPKEYNLAVSFQSQAPTANWDMPYQEACEEASLIMADAFFNGRALSVDGMDTSIHKLVDWELEKFGYYEDTTSKEVVQIAQEYFYLDAVLDYDVTVENIKKYISQNKLILVPAAGRILPNPNFTGDGPLYHMLVIRGYTDKYFITNDPGTKNGKEFLYKYDDLINAIHDWPNENGGQKNEVSEDDMLTGEKVMIAVDK